MSMLTARECHEKKDGLFLLCFPCQLYLSLNSGLLHETILTGIHIILSTKLTVQPNHHVIDGCLPDSVKQVNCIALRLQYIDSRQDNKVEPVFLANPLSWSNAHLRVEIWWRNEDGRCNGDEEDIPTAAAWHSPHLGLDRCLVLLLIAMAWWLWSSSSSNMELTWLVQMEGGGDSIHLPACMI